MAHYFLFPEKDATIYSHPLRDRLNSSIDEILTIEDTQHISSASRYPSRILIQFNTDEITSLIDGKVTSPFSASLNLYATEHTNLALDQHFEVYPLAESYNNGTGRFGNRPQTSNGVSWKFRDNSTLQNSWTLSSFGNGITGSYSSSNAGGGSWFTGSGFEITRSYGYNEELDLSFNVTSPVTKFYSASKFGSTYPNGIPNNGFLLKRSQSQEFNGTEDGTLNFFSLDTHTIYPPYLNISWDDSVYDTGSATDNKIKKTGECYVTLRNNKAEYKKVEEKKFRLNVRSLYPTRKFVTSSNFLDVNYFTSKSFYSLEDYATEEVIIPFSSHSKLSADSEGMYFKIFMNGLQAERYYKLLFKHENEDGITVYDEDYYFKVVN